MFRILTATFANLSGIAVGTLVRVALLVTVSPAVLNAAEVPALALETKIPLGDVSGRIDHLAFDPARQRLYVAELGNNSVGIVDMNVQRLVCTVTGFDEPQGIAYEPTTDTVYVANGGDGSVRVFSGSEFSLLDTIRLGTDADNVRVDRVNSRVYVGYGNGALAVIDPSTRKHIGDIPLNGHPESFQLELRGDEILVNVPDAGEIAVVSRQQQRQVRAWQTARLRANYALALDEAGGRVISVFREPARVQAYELRTGRASDGVAVCADADDVFVDSKRRHIYVICGEGYVDTLDSSDEAFARMGRFKTSAGSRTGLFIPELDRLLVAIRSTRGQPAMVWILRPVL